MTESARSYTPPPHGSLADEAVKLVEVAQEWLGGRSRQDLADAWAGATAGEPADGPPECRGCPICRARRAIGTLNPEVFGHLADAAASLAAAARAMSRPQDAAGRE